MFNEKNSSMNISRRLLFGFLLIALIFSQQTKQPLTLDHLLIDHVYKRASLGIWAWHPQKDGLVIVESDSDKIAQAVEFVSFHTGDTTLMISDDKLIWQDNALDIQDVWISKTGERILFLTQRQKIWRHSFSGIYFVYDFQEKRLTRLASGERLRNVKFSPDGDKVAYVKPDNNLYVTFLSKEREKQLTRDGSEHILNGHFGWVYEEEFGDYDAYRWSPDSKKIAFWREDQSQVKSLTLIDQLTHYPSISTVRYPKVGEENPRLRIGIVPLGFGRTKWLEPGLDSQEYLPRLYWIPGDQSDELLVIHLNRRQNELRILRCEARGRECAEVFFDRDSCWVDLTDDLHFISDTEFVTTSERSGFRHIYRVNVATGDVRQLTRGDWEVSRITGANMEPARIYFTGKKHGVLEQHLYRTNTDGSETVRLDSSAGWHSMTLSPGKRYYIDIHSAVDQPTRFALFSGDGTFMRTLAGPDTTLLENYELTFPEFLTVETPDGVTLNAEITQPPDFDSTQTYPVLVYGYGGPGSQVVTNRWGGFRALWLQVLVNQGYIIFSIDNRGTGGRGKTFKNLAYGDISRYAVADHIAGVKYLRSLSYVDPDRIGIYGWSGGGYLTIMCLLRGADYFKTGVAGAPVTDLRLYDTIWTERYMGLLNENRAGYARANALNYADSLQGNLLVVHGTGDDNVHPQHTWQFLEESIRNGVFPQIMFYPNQSHHFERRSHREHLYRVMTNFILENL